MASYHLNMNEQANGDHEVHREGCSFMPAAQNRIYLGQFESCYGAVNEARKHYWQVDGCYYCSYACHTS